MCGRFTQAYSWREVHGLLDLLGPVRNLEPRCNIAPTTDIDVAVRDETELRLVSIRWGRIPAWWKNSRKEVPSTFNGRAETVADKPMFRAVFKHSRCVTPASLWQPVPMTSDGAMKLFLSNAITEANVAPLNSMGWR